jgi:hypothetical protein
MSMTTWKMFEMWVYSSKPFTKVSQNTVEAADSNTSLGENQNGQDLDTQLRKLEASGKRK